MSFQESEGRFVPMVPSELAGYDFKRDQEGVVFIFERGKRIVLGFTSRENYEELQKDYPSSFIPYQDLLSFDSRLITHETYN